MFEHYLITRFNLKVPQWTDRDKHGVKTLTESWMDHRFKLFERHTVPSVKNQKCQNFTWLVLVDIDTPEKYLEKFPLNCHLILCTSNWLTELRLFLRRQVVAPWLVTTRLDNDDRIHPHFIGTIQAAVEQRKMFLNIPNGWVGKRPVQHKANPFISYVEPSTEARSAYFTPHGLAMAKHAPIKQISKHRLWVQIIHERNYLNA